MADDRLLCGVDISSPHEDMAGLLAEWTGDENTSIFDYVVMPLMKDTFRLENDAIGDIQPVSSDLALPSAQWTRLVVGRPSGWIALDDAALSADVLRAHETALAKEYMWAVHLSLPCLIVPLTTRRCANTARNVRALMLEHAHASMSVWMQVPLTSSDADDDTWTWWNTMRTLCDQPRSLGVALVLTSDLPAAALSARWYGEPLKGVIVPTGVFTSNSKGFPVLSKAHQNFLRPLFRLGIQLIVSDVDASSTRGNRELAYLHHLFDTRPPLGDVERFARGYEDYLQSPLQPLMDNLDSATYETFERDPYKYAAYETAIYQALLDRVKASEKDTTTVIVMVVGAGRGPLVQAALHATRKAERRTRVFAVEKNPNALVTLQGRNAREWGGQVTIVASDMREWRSNGGVLADIVVSELLGSFGDNELSPECLDGAAAFMQPDAISIPVSYTSFFAPVLSTRLHQEAASGSAPAALETPYVVMLRSAHLLATPQPCFTFHHPNERAASSGVVNNDRHTSLSFAIDAPAMCHGFAGFFESVLYGNVLMSILPSTHSPGMFSWFPIYFPLVTPVSLAKDSTLDVSLWRRSDRKRVWYEWALTGPLVLSKIHNADGKSSAIGL